MEKALINHLSPADWIIMCAAVADVKPAHYVSYKLPKKELPPHLELQSVPDIVANLSQLKQPHQLLIGFAAQTGDIIAPALDKLHRKNLDLIVANPIDQPHSGFGTDTNQAVILNQQGQTKAIASCSKLALAHQLYDFILKG
jgi:phosphopantothenoylcysteine decarboxylase/phosphopantothenate--cysteine ligase